MTPAARAQAAIELLDQVIAAARDNGAAADTLIARYFATRRFAGSKDRRAVRDLVYAAIRENGEPPPSGRAAVSGLARYAHGAAEIAWLTPELFDGGRFGPVALSDDEPVWRPQPFAGWATGLVNAALGDGEAVLDLLARAPLDIRVNTLLADSDAVAAELGGERIPGLPAALRLPAGTDLAAFAGRVEVQDAGSQIVTLAVQAAPGQRIVDLCAGAGGKTLALAAAMGNEGHILACDTDRARLTRLAPRAAKAGVTIAEPLLLDPNREADALADWQGRADAVLVDAPCSGTGTWRRNPEARWRLTPDRLDRLAATQARLLDLGAALVRSGGALVHVVCSLLDPEGADQAASFLARHPGWVAEPLDLPAGRPHGPGRRLDPGHDGTDGFFVARFRAPC